MSMLLTAKAMSIKVGNPLRKLVLVKLADNANDQGMCFPSYQYIADVCEISKRSAINHIDALIEMGLVSKKERKNKDGSSSNLYFLHLDKGSEIPAPPSAGDSLGSAGDAPPPSAGDSPITSHSINQSINHTPLTPQGEPSPDEAKKSRSVVEIADPEMVELPDYVNRESWIAYCQMRKAKRSAIKTEHTLKLCLRDLAKHSDGDAKLATAILEQSIANCWTGIFALKTDSRKPLGAMNAHDKSGAWAIGRTITVKSGAMR